MPVDATDGLVHTTIDDSGIYAIVSRPVCTIDCVHGDLSEWNCVCTCNPGSYGPACDGMLTKSKNTLLLSSNKITLEGWKCDSVQCFSGTCVEQASQCTTQTPLGPVR